MTRLHELSIGDEITGTVTSVVPFGAFVAIADDAHGLLHGDQRSEVGSTVKVRILDIDIDRRRASLTLA